MKSFSEKVANLIINSNWFRTEVKHQIRMETGRVLGQILNPEGEKPDWWTDEDDRTWTGLTYGARKQYKRDLKEAAKDVIQELSEKRDYYTQSAEQVLDHIESEHFLDKFVERVQKKQIG